MKCEQQSFMNYLIYLLSDKMPIGLYIKDNQPAKQTMYASEYAALPFLAYDAFFITVRLMLGPGHLNWTWIRMGEVGCDGLD